MRGHIHKRGSMWAVMWDEPRGADGKRRQRKKGGFPTKREAQSHLNSVLASIDKGAYVRPERTTVGEYLNERWLPALTVRLTTKRSYESHVRLYLIPHLGHLPLQQLGRDDLRLMFQRINSGPSAPSAATVRRIHATLRVSLNAALMDDLILRNPAIGLKLAVPPKPEIKVWAAEDLKSFLTGITTDRLYPLYYLMAMTGIRRGEAAGMRWCDVDLPSGRIAVRQQLVQNGKTMEPGAPKTRAGTRSVAIDPRTVDVLRGLKARQAAERLSWGPAYQDTDLLFARENGTSERLDHISAHFALLVAQHDMPKIRLHDLRHTHATLMLSSGVAAKAVSERLGHSSIALTLDTYSHVMPALGEDAALRAAQAVFGPAI